MNGMTCCANPHLTSAQANVDRMEDALQRLYTNCRGPDGKRVCLTRKVGAGGCGGSFDREVRAHSTANGRITSHMLLLAANVRSRATRSCC